MCSSKACGCFSAPKTHRKFKLGEDILYTNTKRGTHNIPGRVIGHTITPYKTEYVVMRTLKGTVTGGRVYLDEKDIYKQERILSRADLYGKLGPEATKIICHLRDSGVIDIKLPPYSN